MSRLDGSQQEVATTPAHLLAERDLMELLDAAGSYNQALTDVLDAAQTSAHALRSTHISLLRLRQLIDALRVQP